MIPHRHRWIAARSLDVCRWCLRRRSPRDGSYPRIVLKEKIDMTERNRSYEGYLGVALLAAIALIAVLAWGLATDPAPKTRVVTRYTTLPRFPAGDNVQGVRGAPFYVRCTAYSNRPGVSIDALNRATDPRLVGFRIVSDCITVAK